MGKAFQIQNKMVWFNSVFFPVSFFCLLEILEKSKITVSNKLILRRIYIANTKEKTSQPRYGSAPNQNRHHGNFPAHKSQ